MYLRPYMWIIMYPICIRLTTILWTVMHLMNLIVFWLFSFFYVYGETRKKNRIYVYEYIVFRRRRENCQLIWINRKHNVLRKQLNCFRLLTIEIILSQLNRLAVELHLKWVYNSDWLNNSQKNNVSKSIQCDYLIVYDNNCVQKCFSIWCNYVSFDKAVKTSWQMISECFDLFKFLTLLLVGSNEDDRTE